MKLKLHLLITDDDNGNQSEIFTTAQALQDRQLELMRTLLEHDRAHGNGEYVAELGRLLELAELPLADPDVFKQAWDEFCEHQRNLNNYYNPTDTEIELPAEYDVLLEAAKEAADWLLECNMGTDQQERGVKLWAAIKALSPRQS